MLSLRSKLARLSSIALPEAPDATFSALAAPPGEVDPAPSEEADARRPASPMAPRPVWLSHREPGANASTIAELRSRIQSTLERGLVRGRAVPAVDTVDLPFVTTETDRGPLHLRVQRLSAAHRTGRAPIITALGASAELLALLALDPTLARCDPRGALFLDTETTGLSGGAGTVAFLVGLSRWDGEGGLLLEQVIVRALGEEAPMLEFVRQRIEAASMLVTFNGKSFDLPLLRTRFVMARVAAPVEPPHLDLLHVARRVHGKRMKQGCRLVALENEVLGFERVDDVASGDIGAVYLHFLRTGNGFALLGVIEHNAWDVVAMVALLGLYGEPLQRALAAEDLPSFARTLHRAGALDRAYEIAETAVRRTQTTESIRTRADIAKARGDRTRALADFETLAGVVDDPSVRLELAKLYEHWVKAPALAMHWVARGTGESPEKTRRRSDRLASKAERAGRRHRPE